MERLDWAVEIRTEDKVIDNGKLTAETITITRIGGCVIGIMLMGIIVVCDIAFLKEKYKRYKKAEKKRIKREKQKLLKKLRFDDKI